MSKNTGQFFIKIKRSEFSVVRLSSAAAKGNEVLSMQSNDISTSRLPPCKEHVIL